ncbi:transcription factor bHLH47-like [Olea europaea subsp. europaea]|uniref:Transcription factor bHLH47-like n=1 Tax=Olea europaea subsp. europaea TaxID=158383 RepID=A0A8S0TAM1_OLEEU|nr:transcription factor bHLH47-like [Olea europaea subsp. europaea]
MAVETSTNRDHSGKKNPGKVPKRISKAEREKTKREHLNELFLALSNALELSEQNNGRASLLDEAIHVVKNTLDEIDSLRKENAALLSGSQYVSMEKKELQDENSALEAQIGKQQCALKGRVSGSQVNLNVAPTECELQELESLGDEHHHRLVCMEPAANPLYLVPVCYQELATTELAGKPMPVVRKPHPRYPTAADTWSSDFLKTNQS